MILQDFVLKTRTYPTIANWGRDECLPKNKEHYLNFPYKVDYRFNSRGYRDLDWPDSIDELKNAIWCIGDSFTVGIGSPFNHTWPQVLQQRTGIRTINVSMDGASNEWIVRKINRLIEIVAPANIVALWSYFHRREDTDITKSDEDRRVYGGRSTDEEDYNNFMNCINLTKQHNSLTQITNFTIPDAQSCYDLQLTWNNFRGPDWPHQTPKNSIEFLQLPDFIKIEIIELLDIDAQFRSLLKRNDVFDNYKQIENILEVPRLDLARDGYHFDIKTSNWLVDQILSKIAICSNSV
jgi:hypothetical protein